MNVTLNYYRLSGILHLFIIGIKRNIISHPENYNFSEHTTTVIGTILTIIDFISFAYFIYGFTNISKKLKNKLLYTSSILLIVYYFIYHIYTLYNTYINMNNNINETMQINDTLFRIVFVLFGLCYLFFGYSIDVLPVFCTIS